MFLDIYICVHTVYTPDMIKSNTRFFRKKLKQHIDNVIEGEMIAITRDNVVVAYLVRPDVVEKQKRKKRKVLEVFSNEAELKKVKIKTKKQKAKEKKAKDIKERLLKKAGIK